VKKEFPNEEAEMKIFIAGASGAIGRLLVPRLVVEGHRVTATTRTPDKLPALRALGADAVLVDGLNKEAVFRAVLAATPDAIVHQMTALATMRNLNKFDNEFALTNRLRTEGTEHLLAAARVAKTRIFVAQSYAGWPCERTGGRIKTEDDRFDPNPPKTMTKSLAAIRALEEMVAKATGMAGIVLRYGSFYGPGTSLSQNGEFVNLIRGRRLPLVGSGGGVWSFLDIDDAAKATKIAIERGVPGIFNIADDVPAEVREWLPELARLIGARPPRRIPTWIARMAIGEAGVSMMTQIRGASNEKAKRVLGWRPACASWRDGFRRCLSADSPFAPTECGALEDFSGRLDAASRN
jgi:nucleoside-diphosphate-sugar epimerase